MSSRQKSSSLTRWMPRCKSRQGESWAPPPPVRTGPQLQFQGQFIVWGAGGHPVPACLPPPASGLRWWMARAPSQHGLQKFSCKATVTYLLQYLPDLTIFPSTTSIHVASSRAVKTRPLPNACIETSTFRPPGYTVPSSPRILDEAEREARYVKAGPPPTTQHGNRDRIGGERPPYGRAISRPHAAIASKQAPPR